MRVYPVQRRQLSFTAFLKVGRFDIGQDDRLQMVVILGTQGSASTTANLMCSRGIILLVKSELQN